MGSERIKNMAKRGIIKAAGRVRRFLYYIQWLEEQERKKTEVVRNYDEDDFAYPWLNSILQKLVSDPVCAQRPQYAWGLLQGAHYAKAIGIPWVSALEFGVAGGNGLVSLERSAEKIEEILKVKIDVFGFDSGVGLPAPKDIRDLPNLYVKGAFQMDWEKLQGRLKRAKLILGMISDTIPSFMATCISPVAFVSFDLDFYSSTLQAFRVLEASQSLLLPRIHCYFDDIMGFTFSDYTGERLAISEFNNSHQTRKLSPIYGLKYFLPVPYNLQDPWSEQFYMAHIFDHDMYGLNDGLVKRLAGDWTELRDV